MSVSKPPMGEHLPVTPGPSTNAYDETGTLDAENRGALSESLITPPLETPIRGLWNRFKAEVDTRSVSAPLAAYCFMTGFLDAVSFLAIFVWCGFQTGNFVQLAIAASRLSGGGNAVFRRIDQQALASLVAFNAGASLGRIGDRVGSRSRLWLVGGTFLQVLFTVAAAIAIWKSGEPSVSIDNIPVLTNPLSFVCIAFMSASLGLQGIMAKRLNTQFGTSVVLTTIWCELFSDPQLFDRRRIPVRDDKLLALISIFFGAFVGRTLVESIGASGALGVGAAIRFIIALGWLVVPANV